MKCSNHPETEANAVCIHCGTGLCADCATKTPTRRIVCSPECAKDLADAEDVLAGIRGKTLGGHRLTGYFCCGAAAVLGIFSVSAGLEQQWEMLTLQLAAAIGLGLSGFFYLRLAGRGEAD